MWFSWNFVSKMNNKQILIIVLFVFMQNVLKVYSSEYKTDDNDSVIVNTTNKSSIATDSDEHSTTKKPNFSSEPDSGGDEYTGDISQKGTILFQKFINHNEIIIQYFGSGDELIENLTSETIIENGDVDQTPYEQEVDILDESGDNILDYTLEDNKYEKYDYQTLNETGEVEDNISDHTLDEDNGEDEDDDEDVILYDDEYNILDYSPITFILCNSCNPSSNCCNKWSLITYFLCCKNSKRKNSS